MYRCNCGQEFHEPEARTVHSATCYVFQEGRAAQLEAEVRRLREALGLQLVGHAHVCRCTACGALKDSSTTGGEK